MYIKTEKTGKDKQQQILNETTKEKREVKNKTKSIEKLLSFKLVLEHSIRPVSEMKRNKMK